MNGMAMWAGIALAVIIAAAGAFVYLVNRLMKLGFMHKLFGDKKGRRIIASVVIIVAGMVICSIWMSAINAIIVLLHVIIFWALCDLLFFIIGKARKQKLAPEVSAICSVILTVCYLSICFYLLDHVWQKDYSLKTTKDVGNIKVVQFADSHVGTTFSGAELIEYVDRINSCEPDVVLITGDFVDDSTSLKDMKDACEALSHLETKYGVYFSFGNHDKGYGDNSARGYNGQDLVDELEANGVIVLQDEAVLIDNRFYIVGRQDKSEESQRGSSRLSASEIMANLDQSKYVIFMDHQPNDYDNEAAANCDLVLSGHTHGGQLLPITEVGVWMGANDKTYGLEHRDNTDFIVTSGISDWELLFKSGCKSEYVVISIGN